MGASKRSGLVPWDGGSSWNFGQVAQDLDKKNRRLGGTQLGPLSVQTQDSCADGGASGFTSRAKALFDQYRYKIVRRIKVIKKKGKKFKKKVKVRRKLKPQGRPLRSNLSLQISFSDTPNPSAGMAITKTAPSTAAACAQAGLKAGRRSVLLLRLGRLDAAAVPAAVHRVAAAPDDLARVDRVPAVL